jgi:hypothetical protein
VSDVDVDVGSPARCEIKISLQPGLRTTVTVSGQEAWKIDHAPMVAFFCFGYFSLPLRYSILI